MAEPAERLADWSDIAVLDDGVRAQIVGGELVIEEMAPGPEHSVTAGMLSAELMPPFYLGRGGGPGGWWIMVEIDVELERHEVYRPDLAGWRKERVPEFPRERPVGVRPDWVCEVLSPSNARFDLGVKRAVYHRNEIPWYWIVDPHNATLTVFKWSEQGYLVVQSAGRGDKVGLQPFEALEIDVSDIMPPV